MRKHKLPKNWVVVGSKSHPDRVYYFNIKTNESSWKEPTTEGTKKASVNDGPKQKKRKTNEMSPIESRTSSDIEEGNDNKDIVRRKKLVAKRHFKATQEFDTIQMAEIKKKMQQRKAKSNSKSNSSTNSFTQINSPTKLYKSDEDKKTEIMTPQMRVIYEKLQKKNMNKKVSKQSQSLQNVKDIETVENIEHRVKVDKRKRRKREGVTKSSSSNQDTSACSSSHESNPTKNDIRCSSIKDTTEIKSERSSITKNILQNKKNSQYKSKETIIENKEYNNSINKKSGRVISKRNLAKDRMDKLKTTLNLQMKDQKNNNKSSQSNDKSLLAIIKDNEIPDIYKTSDMRYKNLRNRLLRNKIIPDENQLLASVKTNMQNQSLNALGENPVNESNNSSLYEEMDWEPMEDEKITFEVQAARIQLCVENAKNETLPIEGNILQFSSIPVQEEKKTLYIVVDTNVFLSNLDAIIKAMVTEFAKYDKPILVIPWTVIRELDYLKNDKFERKSIHLREKARKAINFLHDHFSVKHPRIVGQTLEDVKSNKEKFAIECPDDEILQACLQIRNAERTVALLSYDKNLCNKAMIYDIVALGRDDPLEKIDYIFATNNKNLSLHDMCFEKTQGEGSQILSAFQEELRYSNELFEEIQSMIKELLSAIVSKEMKNLFGETWEKYTIIKPPWTILCVLKCAIKHWIAAISDAFDRQAENLLKELLEIFRTMPKGGRKLKDIAKVLEKSADLIQMIHVDKYSDLINRASSTIKNIKKRYQNYENEIRERKIQEEIGTENDVIQQKCRADRAFNYFNYIYSYARDIGGMAADIVNMPCSFCYEIPNPAPTVEYVKKIQPEIGQNVNHLLRILTEALEGMKDASIDHRTLIDLYHILTNFLPDRTITNTTDLCPLDVYCCLKEKEDVLKLGVRQLQELCTHYCRLASYRCI
ncbi:transcriptional protein SWT1-like isoform X2 [Vespa mandarinia]|uniref:transcriptional protein SWT1-like isoform X2 n=1 Tax=Vespa mandarinia TaxID=7446 RepID=UPI0016165B77|nr:transcriptional protein SWT1-like isoform X2 [Vespa mandarinia]XP_035728904.1 transcriptional protein SWT1-like isoform X2 [Vespa mandarinia]